MTGRLRARPLEEIRDGLSAHDPDDRGDRRHREGGDRRVAGTRLRVRALARAQDERSRRLEALGVEVVHGDLLEFNQVRAALAGIQGAYFVFPIRPGLLQATAYFAQAAKEAGLDGVVNMSQRSAREDATSHAAADHWLAERVFDWSGLAVAHIRPTYFAEWLLYVAPMIKAGRLYVPFGTGKHAPIANAFIEKPRAASE